MHLRMTRTSNRLTAAVRSVAVICVLGSAVGSASVAQAAFFQYETTVTIHGGYLPPDNPLIPVLGTGTDVSILTPGGVTITLSGLSSGVPGDNIDARPPGSDIVFGFISVTGLTNSSLLETIKIPYTWHVLVVDYPTATDVGSLGSTTFDIVGEINGTVGKAGGGKQVNLSSNVYTPPVIPSELVGPTQLYTVTMNSYVPPGPPIGAIPFPGAFGAHVTAVTVPEPSSIALVGLGLMILATPAYKRWRRKSSL